MKFFILVEVIKNLSKLAKINMSSTKIGGWKQATKCGASAAAVQQMCATVWTKDLCPQTVFLEVTGHLANPLLFFFTQTEITPQASSVPVAVKSPDVSNDSTLYFKPSKKISRRGFNDKLCNGKMPHFVHVCLHLEYKTEEKKKK